jgi:thiol-disulfide isomerase/thioredoxin
VAVALAAAAAACRRPPDCEPAERAKLDAILPDQHGREVNLASYRGRPLLINFWATWCGPCKEEIPVLIELAGQHDSSDVAILGISVDDTEADLQKFAAENKVNYPLLAGFGHDELLESYGAEVAVPVTWIVASNGCPLAKHAGAAPRAWFIEQMKALL